MIDGLLVTQPLIGVVGDGHNQLAVLGRYGQEDRVGGRFHGCQHLLGPILRLHFLIEAGQIEKANGYPCFLLRRLDGISDRTDIGAKKVLGIGYLLRNGPLPGVRLTFLGSGFHPSDQREDKQGHDEKEGKPASTSSRSPPSRIQDVADATFDHMAG